MDLPGRLREKIDEWLGRKETPEAPKKRAKAEGGGDKPPPKKSKGSGAANKRKRSWLGYIDLRSLKNDMTIFLLGCWMTTFLFWDVEFSGYIKPPGSRGLYYQVFDCNMGFIISTLLHEKINLKDIVPWWCRVSPIFKDLSNDYGKNPFIIQYHGNLRYPPKATPPKPMVNIVP